MRIIKTEASENSIAEGFVGILSLFCHRARATWGVRTRDVLTTLTLHQCLVHVQLQEATGHALGVWEHSLRSHE